MSYLKSTLFHHCFVFCCETAKRIMVSAWCLNVILTNLLHYITMSYVFWNFKCRGKSMILAMQPRNPSCLLTKLLYIFFSGEQSTVVLPWCIHDPYPLQWCHNGRNGVSNYQPHDCLLNRLFSYRSKKTTKLRVTGLCVGNSPVNSPHKWPVTRKMFPFDDFIMHGRRCFIFLIRPIT